MINIRTKQKIKRAVTNYNAKIRRLEKKGYSNLPELARVTDIVLEEYGDTKLINKRIKELNLFSKRGMENTLTSKSGHKVSKYQVSITKRRIKSAKISLNRRLNSVMFSDPNYKKNDKYLNTLAKLKYIERIGNVNNYNGQALKQISERVKINQINFQGEYSGERNNFINVLTRIKDEYNYNSQDIERIRRNVLKLNDEQFNKLYQESELVRNVFTYYPEKEDDLSYQKLVIDNVEELANNIEELVKKYSNE